MVNFSDFGECRWQQGERFKNGHNQDRHQPGEQRNQGDASFYPSYLSLNVELSHISLSVQKESCGIFIAMVARQFFRPKRL